LLVLVLVLGTEIIGAGGVQGGRENLPADLSQAIADFSHYVQRQMRRDQIPGLSIGFLKGDILWAEGFGYADLENLVPALADSAYRLASITKTFTALAVMQLKEAGKIDLDAEVQAYVPGFPHKKWPITVRQLLGHLGGIRHYRDDSSEVRIKVPKNTQQSLAIFKDFALVAEPGTKYNYSTYGFNLLGAVIEAAGGMSYAEHIRRYIFLPLGMKASRLDDPVDLIPHRVRGYRLIGGKIKNSEYVDVSSRFAGGGTRSSVTDLLRYAKGICEGRLLQTESWKQIFTSMANRAGRMTGYGMGWVVLPWKGHFQVSHGGSQPETRTYLTIFPTEMFAIAVAANLEGADLMPYVRRLAELVLKEDLDSAAYLPDASEQIQYNTCAQMVSYGMSHLDFFGPEMADELPGLRASFAFLREALDPRSIRQDPMKARAKLNAGFHPAAGQALTKVGVHMAALLREAYGQDRSRTYRENPLRFFSDYQELAKKPYTIPSDLSRLVREWLRDWKATYTDYERSLHISPDMDFLELGSRLKERFSSARIRPDFSRPLADVADHFLDSAEIEKSREILELGSALYPDHPLVLLGAAAIHLIRGEEATARRLYRKTHKLQPIPLDHIDDQVTRLLAGEKFHELTILTDIAVELYPKNVRLHAEIGFLYLRMGEKHLAGRYLQKALELDPGYPGVREKLASLKKR
jgi:CubicO group peptidase (beta-lactamase class C family)